jgi:hypothetical protein
MLNLTFDLRQQPLILDLHLLYPKHRLTISNSSSNATYVRLSNSSNATRVDIPSSSNATPIMSSRMNAPACAAISTVEADVIVTTYVHEVGTFGPNNWDSFEDNNGENSSDGYAGYYYDYYGYRRLASEDGDGSPRPLKRHKSLTYTPSEFSCALRSSNSGWLTRFRCCYRHPPDREPHR